MARGTRANLLLKHGMLSSGNQYDVLIIDGVISRLEPQLLDHTLDPSIEKIDLTGYVLLPAATEPHAHLDKAMLLNRAPNISGDLSGAIKAIRGAYSSMSISDIRERARQALRIAVSRGFTDIRTHSNCGDELGLRAIEALVEVREEMRQIIGLQIVALVETPITGQAGRSNRASLRSALEAGADLVGGCPAIDPDPAQAVLALLFEASKAGTGIDLHIDETTDPSVETLRLLAEAVSESGFSGQVTASHCVSLGAQSLERCRDTAEKVAAAGIRVVTLPQSNLYLQGRLASVNQPRGLTAISELRKAGVVVAAGGDNWRDPFNQMGRIDPMEAASLMVTAGHLLPAEAYDSVSAAARTILGLPPVCLEPGYPADLLAVKASSLADALAGASEQRIVIRAGQVTARTEVRTVFADGS
jgi:cytosine deaminase